MSVVPVHLPTPVTIGVLISLGVVYALLAVLVILPLLALRSRRQGDRRCVRSSAAATLLDVAAANRRSSHPREHVTCTADGSGRKRRADLDILECGCLRGRSSSLPPPTITIETQRLSLTDAASDVASSASSLTAIPLRPCGGPLQFALVTTCRADPADDGDEKGDMTSSDLFRWSLTENISRFNDNYVNEVRPHLLPVQPIQSSQKGCRESPSDDGVAVLDADAGTCARAPESCSCRRDRLVQRSGINVSSAKVNAAHDVLLEGKEQASSPLLTTASERRSCDESSEVTRVEDDILGLSKHDAVTRVVLPVPDVCL